ncbi:MAG: hypothetical protein NT096_00655 [Proteobacteria bacterium]|nr:hypothetical protein [Pseudomonadota bacterium]
MENGEIILLATGMGKKKREAILNYKGDLPFGGDYTVHDLAEILTDDYLRKKVENVYDLLKRNLNLADKEVQEIAKGILTNISIMKDLPEKPSLERVIRLLSQAQLKKISRIVK